MCIFLSNFYYICRDYIHKCEISQKEKTKYYILTHIRNLENGTDRPICKAETDTNIENKYTDTMGKKRWVMNWDIGLKYIYTIMYKMAT